MFMIKAEPVLDMPKNDFGLLFDLFGISQFIKL